jgi:hypothetical protein
MGKDWVLKTKKSAIADSNDWYCKNYLGFSYYMIQNCNVS